MKSDISVIAFVWVAGVVLVWVNEVVSVGKLWGFALCSVDASEDRHRTTFRAELARVSHRHALVAGYPAPF